MVWTYSGNPKSSAKDEVRFLIGDTDSTDQLLQDNEIVYLLAVSPDPGTRFNNYVAAAAASRALAAKFAKDRDKTVGSLSLQNSQRYAHYAALATELGTMSAGVMGRPAGVPVLGGGGATYLGGSW